MKYNYYDEVYRDLRELLLESFTEEEISDMSEDDIIDWAWDDDMITGNGPNGYDYPEVVAEYVKDNMAFCLGAAAEGGMQLRDLAAKSDAEIFITLDTIARCQVLYEVADRIVENFRKDNEE